MKRLGTQNGLATALFLVSWLSFLGWQLGEFRRAAETASERHSPQSLSDWLALVAFGSLIAGIVVAARRGQAYFFEVRSYTTALWIVAGVAFAVAIIESSYLQWFGHDSTMGGYIGPATDLSRNALLAIGVSLTLVGIWRRKRSRLAPALTMASALSMLVLVPLGPVFFMWWFKRIYPREAAPRHG